MTTLLIDFNSRINKCFRLFIFLISVAENVKLQCTITELLLEINRRGPYASVFWARLKQHSATTKEHVL